MIELYLAVPTMETSFIKERVSEDFKILKTHIDRPFGTRFFLLRTTEEEAIILTLKYGKGTTQGVSLK